MKRLLSLLLTAVLCLSAALPALASGISDFPDVPADYWGRSYIEEMVAKGVVAGVENGLFDPEGRVSAAQFSTMLSRAFFAQELANETATGDVWWVRFVMNAYHCGLLDGTQAGSTYAGVWVWDPEEVEAPLSRYDMALMMYNTLEALGMELPGQEELEATQARIADFHIVPAKYAPAVLTMYHLGALSGVDEAGSFGGTGEMTRAQSCVVMFRLFQIAENRPQPPTEPAAQEPTQPPTEEPTQPPAEEPTEAPAEEPTEAPTQAPTDPVEEPAQEGLGDVYEAVRLINAERAAVGLPALVADETVMEMAQVRAEECASVGSIRYNGKSHTRPDDTPWHTILEQYSFSFSVAGENLGGGNTRLTAASQVQGWMDSPGHRANILHEEAVLIGIGYAMADGYHYWAMIFTG